jgi:YVTN family beta-propeller protein
VIEPDSGDVIDVVAVGTRPGPIAAGGGSIWVGNLDDRTVTRIDSRERRVLQNITLDRRTPTGLAFGFGSLWVAHGLRGEVSRINPQFNDVSPPIEVADTGFGSPGGSVAVGLGSVWVVFGDSTFGRIDPRAGRVLESTRAGSLPTGVAVASGSVWVANSGDSTVERYALATFTEAPIRTFNVGRRPLGIAGGSAVWVANNATGTVTRIDPDAGASVPISVGKGPTAVAAGEDAVWVANTGEGTLSFIDPETNEVERTVEVGNAPSGLVLADGLLWVSVQSP